MPESQVLPALICGLMTGLLIALVPVPASTPWQKRRDPALLSVSRTTATGADTGAMRAAGSVVAARVSVSADPQPLPTPDAATLLDLTAAMLRAGLGIEAAVHQLSRDVPGCTSLARVHRGLAAGQRWQDAWSCVDSQTQLRQFGEELAFAHATGAPTVQLLEATAVQARRRRRQAVEEQAARLGVQMVLPLGLCFLPGFIMLGVIPVVLGLVEELA